MKENAPVAVAVLNAGDGGQGMQVGYYLTSWEYGTTPSRVAYGIRARLLCGETILDEAEVDDVACTAEKAMRLVELLAKNAVTPVSLRDVIEDCLAG